jgi:hypothetical protein
MDAEWFGEPDYERSLWSPKGIERDHTRFTRALAVIRSNPGWFLKVMLRRAGFMLCYNDSSNPGGWPIYTRLVPCISGETPFTHSLASSDQMEVAWSNSEIGRFSGGKIISPSALVFPLPNAQTAILTGGDDWWGVGFVSDSIVTEKFRDYILRIQFSLKEGDAVAVVTGADVNTALGAVSLASAAADERKAQKHRRKKAGPLTTSEDPNAIGTSPSLFASIPFVSGQQSEIRLAFGYGDSLPTLDLERVDLLQAGPTRHSWMRYPRVFLRFLQKSLYVTTRMLPIVLSGIALLVLARRGKTLVFILAVPLYYLCVQSALHTEYRYITAIHYFLFEAAAVAIYCLAGMIGAASRTVVLKAFQYIALGIWRLA